MVRSLASLVFAAACTVTQAARAASTADLPTDTPHLPEISPRYTSSYFVEGGYRPPTGTQEKRWSANNLFDFLRYPVNEQRTYFDIGMAIAEAITGGANVKAFRTPNGLTFGIEGLLTDPLVGLQGEDASTLDWLSNGIGSYFSMLGNPYEPNFIPYIIVIVTESKSTSIKFDANSEIANIDAFLLNEIEMASRDAWPLVTEYTGVVILAVEIDRLGPDGKSRPLRHRMECLPAMSKLNMIANASCRR